MKSAVIAICAAASLLAPAFAEAQAPTRVRGTIGAVSGSVMTVNAAGGKSVDVRFDDTTRIVFAQPIAMSDIKSGDFLGVTSVKRGDGTLAAYDVRRFPKPVNPGHRPFDGRDDQTMTNATVSATVQSASGRELVLNYEGGSQKIVVPQGAAITTLTPGQRSQLVPGSYVSLTAAADSAGKLTARSIEVRKDAPKPVQ
jgi:hypothetical protein